MVEALDDAELPSRGSVNRNVPIQGRLRTSSPARDASNRQPENEKSTSLSVVEFSQPDMSIQLDPDFGCRHKRSQLSHCDAMQRATTRVLRSKVGKGGSSIASFSNVF
jgi:hypothetical protein